LESEFIINGGVFIMPHQSGSFKVGSTYYWDDNTEVPTKRGLEELTEKLNKMLKTDYEILSHKAGIRPTVNDRRPFLGFHPKYKNMGVFNGLGTKGVMLAPFFANHFCQHIKNSTNLLKEVDIQRYAKFYTV
jgi:glycine oxidase